MKWTFCRFEPGTTPIASQKVYHSTISSPPKNGMFNRRGLSFASLPTEWIICTRMGINRHIHICLLDDELVESSTTSNQIKARGANANANANAMHIYKKPLVPSLLNSFTTLSIMWILPYIFVQRNNNRVIEISMHVAPWINSIIQSKR